MTVEIFVTAAEHEAQLVEAGRLYDEEQAEKAKQETAEGEAANDAEPVAEAAE